jgi:DNA-binding SARP family transcriptional activator
MNDLRIHLFGKFEICHDDEQQTRCYTPQVQELMAYILVHHERPQARDKLVDLFWKGCDTQHAKRQLRQLLWRYHSALKLCLDNQDNARELLKIEPDWVSFNTHANVWVDAHAFQRAVSQLPALSGHTASKEDAQALRTAISLYRGDLLEGWYQDWCIVERERLQNVYLAMLDCLMRYCETQDDYIGAVSYGEQILTYDRAHERIHQRLMLLHHGAGDTHAALRQFESCERALREELALPPNDDTMAIHNRIRDPHATYAANAFPSSSVTTLKSVVDHLNQLQATLADLQQQARRDLISLQQILTRHPPS